MKETLSHSSIADHLSVIFSGSFPFACYAFDKKKGKILYVNSQFFKIWKLTSLEQPVRQGKMDHMELASIIRSMVDKPEKIFINTDTDIEDIFPPVYEEEILLSRGDIFRQFYTRINNIQNEYLGDVYIYEDVTTKTLSNFVRDKSYELYFQNLLGNKIELESQALQQAIDMSSPEGIINKVQVPQDMIRVIEAWSKKLSGISDLKQILDEICSVCSRNFKAPITNISLFDEKKNVLSYAASYGDPQGLLKQIPPFSGFIYKNYITSHEMVNIIPATLDIPFIPGSLIYKQLDVATTLTVPLLFGKKLLGSLNLFYKKGARPLNNKEKKFLILFSTYVSLQINNAILESESARKSLELQVLGEISANLQKAEAIKVMLGLIIQTTRNRFNADMVLLSLTISSNYQIVREEQDQTLIFEPISEAQIQSITSLLDGDARYIEEITDNQRAFLERAHIPFDGSICSFAVIRMKSFDQPIGFLFFGYKNHQEFPSSEKNLMLALANICGNALYRASVVENLEKRVAERTKLLSLLFEITKFASTNTDKDAFLNLSLSKIIEAANAIIAVIDLYDPVEKKIINSLLKDNVRQHIQKLQFSGFQQQFSQTVFSKQKTVINKTNHPLLSNPAASVEAKNISYIGIPITIRNNRFGVLCVFRPDEKGWGEEDINLLQSVVEQIAIALENYNLYILAEKNALKEERTRLARELHDSVTQSLYSLSLFAEASKQSLSANNYERLEQNINFIAETAHQSLKEMRLLVYELRPPELEKIGLIGALRKRLDAIEKRVGIKVILNVHEKIPLPIQVENGLYRIAQEALNNSLKHAKATIIEIIINRTDKDLSMEIKDNGIGFNQGAMDDTGGMGLSIIKERSAHIDAHFEIHSTPDNGTTVKIRVPISEKGNENDRK